MRLNGVNELEGGKVALNHILKQSVFLRFDDPLYLPIRRLESSGKSIDLSNFPTAAFLPFEL